MTSLAPIGDTDVAERVDALARLVDDAARLLAAQGETEAGCRLVARAWWLAGPVAPKAAKRLDATLHQLTRVYEKRVYEKGARA